MIHRIACSRSTLFRSCSSRAINAASPLRRNSRPLSTTPLLLYPSAAIDMERTDTTERLRALRELMKARALDAYIVPSEDAHASEYIAACDARRAHVSGFTGSAGTAVVTPARAALATDGRYFNQAAQQLDGNWELLKQGLDDVPTWQEWTAERVSADGARNVGVDSTLLTAPDARRLEDRIRKAGGRLVGSTENLVDAIWPHRPPRPSNPVTVLGQEFAGKGFEEKLAELRKELDKKKSAGLVVSMLDEVAWLFNLRGSDIPYNPVFFAYAVVTPDAARLYVDAGKVDERVRAHLGDAVELRPYFAIFEDTLALAAARKEERAKASEAAAAGTPPAPPPRKFTITTSASWALFQALGGEDQVDEARSPIDEAKAIKNATELAGMRACHVRDGAALTEYFAWLEHALTVEQARIDEVQAADKLEQIRSKGEHFVGLSFDAISSTGPNAAIIHYKPEPGRCATLDPGAVYLCDSGAQYLDGTTDTTRTLHFGTPTEMEREAYTLVLKGVIALEKVVFPKGTKGVALDTMARQYLWREGLDYRHGTGHGVGSYLNVHEGPVGVGTSAACANVAMSPGNVISDEPGYYEDGKFGIRIENVIICVEADPQPRYRFGDKPWLSFDHATMTPMCRRLIDPARLTRRELEWLNQYHAEVREKTRGFFKKAKDRESAEEKVQRERALQWLIRETEPLQGAKAEEE